VPEKNGEKLEVSRITARPKFSCQSFANPLQVSILIWLLYCWPTRSVALYIYYSLLQF